MLVIVLLRGIVEYSIANPADGVEREWFPRGDAALLVTVVVRFCVDNKFHRVMLSELKAVAWMHGLDQDLPTMRVSDWIG